MMGVGWGRGVSASREKQHQDRTYVGCKQARPLVSLPSFSSPTPQHPSSNNPLKKFKLWTTQLRTFCSLAGNSHFPSRKHGPLLGLAEQSLATFIRGGHGVGVRVRGEIQQEQNTNGHLNILSFPKCSRKFIQTTVWRMCRGEE